MHPAYRIPEQFAATLQIPSIHLVNPEGQGLPVLFEQLELYTWQLPSGHLFGKSSLQPSKRGQKVKLLLQEPSEHITP